MSSESTSESPDKTFKSYFDAGAAHALASQVAAAWPHFDQARFVALATRSLEAKAFAARVTQFSEALAATLPEDRSEALRILSASLPPTLPDCEGVTDGWLQWPVGQFIADHGLPHFEVAMEAMVALTQRFSSEFAVRPFVEQQPEATFARLQALSTHPSPHVRRWCSEGVRPRLPWGRRLQALVRDPAPIWPLLEALKDDPERYVQRSVANCLNDIAKDHPEAVVAACERWSVAAPAARAWVIKHALRSLLKDGHPKALALLGFAAPKHMDATLRLSASHVAIGERVTLKAVLRNRAMAPQPLMVDYVVAFLRKAGTHSEKVFKWKQLTLAPGAELSLEKHHPFRLTSIRALYPGAHRVALQLNGQRVAEAALTLLPEKEAR